MKEIYKVYYNTKNEEYKEEHFFATLTAAKKFQNQKNKDRINWIKVVFGDDWNDWLEKHKDNEMEALEHIADYYYGICIWYTVKIDLED